MRLLPALPGSATDALLPPSAAFSPLWSAALAPVLRSLRAPPLPALTLAHSAAPSRPVSFTQPSVGRCSARGLPLVQEAFADMKRTERASDRRKRSISLTSTQLSLTKLNLNPQTGLLKSDQPRCLHIPHVLIFSQMCILILNKQHKHTHAHRGCCVHTENHILISLSTI